MNELHQTIRVNIICKDNDELKISIITDTKTTIAKLKRNAEQQFLQLYGVSMLVSVVEDLNGFILSNNSTVGQHLSNNQTIFVQLHREKTGSNMNMPNNATDIFMTLRYVCSSALKKLENLQHQLNPIDIFPEIIHLGFWHANTDIVLMVSAALNNILSIESIDSFYKNCHQVQNCLLIKLLNFWFCEVPNSFLLYTQICNNLLELLLKLSSSERYCQILKGNQKLMRSMVELSKDASISIESKKMALMVIKNIQSNGKATLISKTKSSYIPTILEGSLVGQNIQDILNMLADQSQDVKLEALEILAHDSSQQLITEACVRFDYYDKLTNIFTIQKFQDKKQTKNFNFVVKTILNHTTREKAKEVMQKDILKKTHNFLLQAPLQTHQIVILYVDTLTKQSTAKAVLNIELACQFINSPYPEFQKIIVEGIGQMSEKDKKHSPMKLLAYIKDLIKLALKSEDEKVSASSLKIISNLTLDEQCRYQIINLKGIEVFAKFLEVKNQREEIQRVSSKALLNLAISSRQNKAKVLALLGNVLEKYYKREFDSISSGYLENILKANQI